MPVAYKLDFERPVNEFEDQIAALQAVPTTDARDNFNAEIQELRKAQRQALRKVYRTLSPWDIVRVARHPQRPQTRDYIAHICKDFCEIHGDRRFADDPAVVAGFARINSRKVVLIGHHKGRDTPEKLACHFGCAHPEGYRKALRAMKLAEKFSLPIVTLVDTPGAYPGLGAEERGQAQAIAVNLLEMSRLNTPILSIVVGEGGSGGALGIAVADRVAMMEFAWYSVISPEGCAAILWKQANPQTNLEAAESLCLTAKHNKRLGIIDAIIKEPVGGAHRDHQAASQSLTNWITEQLAELDQLPKEQLTKFRYQRFRSLGEFKERHSAHHH